MSRAAPGDTVWVAPGEYRRLRVPSGIRLIAEGGPADTVFRDGTGPVIDASGAAETTIIEGVTADGIGGAEGVIGLSSSRARIRNCVIRNGWSGVRGLFANPVVEDCSILDCRNGVYLFESGGAFRGNEITGCANGVMLVSASPGLSGNVIRGNGVGVSVAGNSGPRIGGSLSAANRILDNPGGAVFNTATTSRAGLRRMDPRTVIARFNHWGSDCPDPLLFRGPVDYRPWVDGAGRKADGDCGG